MMKKLALVLAGLLALAGIAGGCGSSTGSKPAGGDKKVVLKVGGLLRFPMQRFWNR